MLRELIPAAGPLAHRQGRHGAALRLRHVRTIICGLPGQGEPVSSMVFRPAKTAGQPPEMPSRTRVPGPKLAVDGELSDALVVGRGGAPVGHGADGVPGASDLLPRYEGASRPERLRKPNYCRSLRSEIDDNVVPRSAEVAVTVAGRHPQPVTGSAITRRPTAPSGDVHR
jgi:hypothetical protein